MLGFLKRLFVGPTPVYANTGVGHVSSAVAPISDSRKQAILRGMLHDPRYTFRTTSSLARAIGADHEEVEFHLKEIGARQDRRGRALWTIKKDMGDND